MFSKRIKEETSQRLSGGDKIYVSLGSGPGTVSATAQKGFNKMRIDDVLCDYTIKVEGKQLKVHKALLAAVSDYFRSMFTGGMLESKQDFVELKDTSVSGVEAVLDFIYTGELAINIECVNDILATASLTQVEDALKLCELFLQDALDPYNCLEVLNIADVYNLEDTKQHCQQYITGNFERITHTDEFSKITVEQLERIVCREDLGIDSELNLFFNLMLWIAYDRREREKHATRLLKHVRFGLISPEDIVDEIQAHSIMNTNSECRKFVDEALKYHVLPLRQPLSNMQSIRTQVRGEPALIVHDTNESPEQLRLVPKNMQWEKLPNAPQLRVSTASLATHNNFLFVCGGKKTPTADPNNILRMYNPASDKWTTLANMRECRSGFPLVELDEKLYALGGETVDSICTSTVEQYCIEKCKWQDVKPLPQGLISHAACACKSKLYVSGGYNTSIQRQSTMYSYHPAIDKWDHLQPMIKVRSRHTMCSNNVDEVFVIDCLSDHIETYNVNTDQWTLLDRVDLAALHISLPVRECRIVTNNTDVYFISEQVDDPTDSTNFKLDLKSMSVRKFERYTGLDSKPFGYFLTIPLKGEPLKL
ncbi:unnamed protein product [Owenia fusiformis]|uniref:Uncharacterized protein n=1 Tax=Owenia fusiformis TaxID=6347 RepID=A0A8J1TP82_OWEFU|nr:unnamed protein product [Owenia fusiformis]